ncbi:heme exporter protein CcmB [Microaerobacter geothermalis]|uniref:heme exporter protein CcmB n=1 Tax=Microaerobacter geothermalis TaxID=674972 RepID=UPI001F1F7D2B|nr:heme exporter protein CcmB [Microaerobacter geothermalis]MCF6092547.1 heme exporter protein CcmB [Microaerobacter geothermalis]
MAKQILALVKKDWFIEWRSKWLFSMMILISFLLFFTISMSLEDSIGVEESILWVVLLIVTAQVSQRQISRETVNQTWEGIQMAPVDLGAVFLSKWIVMMALVGTSYFIVLPLYFLFFQVDQVNIVPFLITLFFATGGFIAVAMFMSVITIYTSLAEFVILLLEIPVLIPLLIGVIQMSKYLFFGGESFPWLWFGLIVGFTIIFTVLPTLLLSLVKEV